MFFRWGKSVGGPARTLPRGGRTIRSRRDAALALASKGPAFGDFYLGDCLVRPSRGEVVHGGSVTRAEPKVMDVLVCLAEHAGDVVAKDEIYRVVWSDACVSDHVLTHTIWQIRQALGDREAIESVPKRGYRLVVPVRLAAADVALDPVAESASPPRRCRWAAPVLLILFGSLILASLSRTILLTRWQAHPVPLRSLVVLPLVNFSSDPEQEYFADGITEELTTDLSKIESLQVISRTSAMRYKATKRSLAEIGRELNVDGVVEGSVQRSGTRVRIAVQLVDANTERHLWAETYQRDLGDVLTLRSEVARAIADRLRITLMPEDQRRLRKPGASNAAAYEAFLRGRHFFGLAQYAKSAEWFEEAVKEDPEYALAYANLAEAYGMLNFTAGYRDPVYFEKRTAAAWRAMQLDDKLAEVHDFLGDRNFYGEWDWAAGEAEYRRAVELDPGSVDARLHLACAAWVLRRFEEALTELKALPGSGSAFAQCESEPRLTATRCGPAGAGTRTGPEGDSPESAERASPRDRGGPSGGAGTGAGVPDGAPARGTAQPGGRARLRRDGARARRERPGGVLDVSAGAASPAVAIREQARSGGGARANPRAPGAAGSCLAFARKRLSGA